MILTGSDKQVAYAETLRTRTLSNPCVDTFGHLAYSMFADVTDEMKNEHLACLQNFSGCAGDLIDAINMQTWSLRGTSVGYHEFMKKICGYRRENKQWIK